MTKKEKMPVLFLGHGSPINAVEDNDYTQALKLIAQKMTNLKGILMISAHWETKGSWVTAMEKPKTIHDFHGFPPELYDIQYPADGNIKLAQNIKDKIPQVQLDKEKWGLDHGSWAVLRHIFPEADIPVIQLSLDVDKPMKDHFELGQKLRFLRDEGIVIIGSGNIVHNLKEVNWNRDAKAYDWVLEFDHWLTGKLIERDFDPLIHPFLNHSAAQASIPTLEHYLPLLYTLGASEKSDQLDFDYEGFQNASMSMRCLRFSPAS